VDSTQPPQTPARPSVIDPIAGALSRTGKVLFRPFDVTKWLALGFCAWLAWLGEGGGGGVGSHWDLSEERALYEYGRAEDWVLAHLGLVLFLVVGLILLGLVVWVLLTWLSSRGKFMLLDGVVRDRGAVVEPWRQFSAQGNSLFLFRIVLGLVGLVVIGATVALMVLSLLALGFDDGDPGIAGIALLCVWVLVILVLAFALGLVIVAANDFVVPIMWVRKCLVMDAWSEFLSVLSANLGIFILYVLMKILIAIVIAFIACCAGCATCCVAALPYVGTVILLPVHVFRRSFSIGFLSQFSPDYASLAPVETPPPVAAPEASS
jgi:hypothetical protein